MENTNLTDGQLERTVYFDYLRVFAIIAVMILHISGQNWSVADVNGFAWQVFNFFDSIVRWGVPVFVMISGALFLGREISIRKIYSKYILRMLISFFVWSAIYAGFAHGSVISRISLLVHGHYHMWFILMIIGLYMCIPVIKPIAGDTDRTRYFLLLAFIFAFAVPTLVTLANDFAGKAVVKGVSVLNDDIDTMNMNLVLGFTSYFVLGYYLNKINLSKKQRTIIYILGAIGFISTIGLDAVVALKTQRCCGRYYGNFCVNILLESVAVFTFFKYKKRKPEQTNPMILKLSKYSFGAYLVHALILEQLKIHFGLTTLSFNPVLSIFCIFIIVFVVSFLISGVLHHIPIIKKYMV